MHVRLSIMSLLIVATMTTTVSRPFINRDELPATRQETELTPEEEQEARAISRRFQKRLRATNDLGEIIDEMFVRDFAERLARAPQNWLPWVFLDKNLIAYASPNELRRYYVASMNFYALYYRLNEEARRLQQQSENNEDELKLEDVLSSEVIDTLFSNPTIAELAREGESDERAKDDDDHQSAESGDSAQAAKAKTEADANRATEESEVGIIKTLPQLNDASATLEKANGLMRQRLAEMSRRAQAASKSEDTENEPDSPKPDLTSLDDWEYGYPENTPVIHLEGSPFCLYLIKVDGQLRILSVHIYVD